MKTATEIVKEIMHHLGVEHIDLVHFASCKRIVEIEMLEAYKQGCTDAAELARGQSVWQDYYRDILTLRDNKTI